MQFTDLPQVWEQTFESLKVANYRRYFIGQGLSQCGDWMQTVALGWLVLVITGSGTALGTLLALRFAPLLFGVFTGAIVDRFEKRRILFITQSSFALLALLLTLLAYSGAAQVWMLFVIAFAFGCVDVIDRPTRQTFVHQMVGRDKLRNAVTLTATEANLARAVGPIFAGALIPTIGIPACFFLNALSYVAVLTMLSRMNPSEFHVEPRSSSLTDSHVLSGLRYAASVPVILSVLLSMAVIGTFSYEFQTSLPLLARLTFSGTAADYAALLSAMGAGSVAGGLLVASRKHVSLHEFIVVAFLFGFFMCLTAVMPTLGLATVGMIFVGFFSIMFTSTGNTMIQLESEPHMRGRVMSLWMMANFGSTLLGGPIIGFIGEYVGPRWGVATGGIAALLTAIVAGGRLIDREKLFSIPSFIKITQEEEIVEERNV